MQASTLVQMQDQQYGRVIYGTVVSVFIGADIFALNYVVIRPHAQPNKCDSVNRVILYGHLGVPDVSVGDEVIPTTRIGANEATQAHIHLEIRDYEDSFWGFSANLWFYNPAYYMHSSGMKILQAQAKKQFDKQIGNGVTFVGEKDGNGNPILGDPYTQPIRIPR